MSQRCIDVERFARYLKLLMLRHRAQGTHIVQTVGNLDEDHTNVCIHRQDQLAKVFRLEALYVSLGKYLATDLGQSEHNLSHLRTEELLYILLRVLRVLDHIVE